MSDEKNNNQEEANQCSANKPCFWAKILPYIGVFFIIMLIIGIFGGC